MSLKLFLNFETFSLTHYSHCQFLEKKIITFKVISCQENDTKICNFIVIFWKGKLSVGYKVESHVWCM
jgi:hypothetical protein